MRSVKLRIGAILLLAAFSLCSLPIASFADGIKILMFLWQGETSAEEAFKKTLAEEFPDKAIDYTMLDTYKSMDRLKELIDSTDQTHYQLIYTYGSAITSKVVKSFKITPIVFDIVFDPIDYKITESWEKKQPNLTGASNSIPVNLKVQKMHEVFGKGDIGFIYNPLDKKSVYMKEEIEACLNELGAELLPFEFRENFDSLNAYLDSIKNRAKCIYLPTEYIVVGYIERILSDINRVKIPTCVTSKAYLKRGALLCITAGYDEMGKIAGKLAAQILKNVKPDDLPVRRPSESDITLYANSYLLKRLKIEFNKDLDIKYVD